MKTHLELRWFLSVCEAGYGAPHAPNRWEPGSEEVFLFCWRRSRDEDAHRHPRVRLWDTLVSVLRVTTGPAACWAQREGQAPWHHFHWSASHLNSARAALAQPGELLFLLHAQ